MSRTNFYYLKNFATNRIGWLLVMVNVIIFAYLFKEINFLQEMFHGYCDENGTQIVGFIQSSSLFNFLFNQFIADDHRATFIKYYIFKLQ